MILGGGNPTKHNETLIEDVNTNHRNPTSYSNFSHSDMITQSCYVQNPANLSAGCHDTGRGNSYDITQQNLPNNFKPMYNTMLPTYNYQQSNIIQSYPYNSNSYTYNAVDSGIGLESNPGRSTMSGLSMEGFSIQKDKGDMTFHDQYHIDYSINAAVRESYNDFNADSTHHLVLNKPIIDPEVTPMIETKYEQRPLAPTKLREDVNNKAQTDAKIQDNAAELRRRQLFQKTEYPSFGIR